MRCWPRSEARGPRSYLAPLVVLVALAATAHAGVMPHRAGLYAASASADTPTPLPMIASKIALDVRGPLVTASVAQTFRNDSDRVVEATYIFPLPADAAVSAMTIEIGSRHIHAQIARRAEAAQRYEDAIAAGVGAGLLEEERADVFTQTVSAIPAHGTVTVTLRFDSAARLEHGAWQLALPLVVAPRFVPGNATGRATTGTGHAPDTARAPDASRVTPTGAPEAGGLTEVTLTFADDVDDVQSPTHELHGHGRELSFVDPHGDHDAVVRWRVHDRSRGWVEQEGGDAGEAFAAVVVEAPPATPRTHALRALYVIDRAVTTRGDGDAVLRPLARALLAAADRKDRIALAGIANVAEGEPDAARQVVEEAWSNPGNSGGARDLTAELTALRVDGAAVVLASDGLVADDRAALAAAKRIGARIHVIGVGPAPNRALLAAIARATGGTLRFVAVGDDLVALAHDVLADVAAPPQPTVVTWGALVAHDVVPATLVLGAGQGALVVAKLDHMGAHGGAGHAANARAAGDIFALATVAAPRAPEGATTSRGPLARRWARARLDELVAAGDHAAIAQLALGYGLVSPETSLIAVGDEVIEQGGVKHTVAVPVSVPAGMRWQEVRRALAVHTPVYDRNKDDEQAADKTGEDKREADHHSHTHSTADHDRDAADEKAKDQPRTDGKPIATKAAPKPVMHEPPAAPSSAPAVSAKATTSSASVTGKATVTKPVAGAARTPIAAGPTPGTTVSPPVVAVAPQAAEADAAEEVVTVTGMQLSSEQSVQIDRRGLSVSLAGGLAITAGRVDALAAARTRLAWGWPLAFGVEGSLWLVGGLHLQGDVLATIDYLRLGRHLAIGAGVGVHDGDGVGPAGELQLRVPLRSRLSPYLRYDGAILLDDGATHGQHAVTLGVEAGF
jgi:Ca-activated chloride channel family protein